MLLTINGHLQFSRSVAALKQTRPGHYEGATNNGTPFVIEGGKKFGGGRKDWFCDISGDSYNCTSIIDAIKLIDSNWS